MANREDPHAILQRNAALGSLANAAAPGQAAGTDGTKLASFGSVFIDALQKVNELGEQEDKAAEAYEKGDITDIATVSLLAARSSVAFEATLQVRNKLLSAYNDIMAMQI